ncbi:dynein heavy chain and region D6 of dynein motor-domain-containing protein [Chytriomyces cf. hyalinus JEL632]|nr:dynein heavy chain and region D6 of dynein motor-domain-containing protein [Chytriomyces cf. hyalinus JEL632]
MFFMFLLGKDAWILAVNKYNDLISRVENQIIARLRYRLGTVKNANEMFRVFSKFNDLFIIRGAIQEYQTQLIENVKKDTATSVVSIISKDLFTVTYTRAAKSLLHDDQVIFRVLLTYINVRNTEGFSLAESAIPSATNFENYVLLKTVHLAPTWLGLLEKRLHTLKSHKSFRLFLATEPFRPVCSECRERSCLSHLRVSKPIYWKHFQAFRKHARLEGPAERVRLYFLVAWLHAVVQERLRYTPLGWTKQYEFNDSDYEMCLVLIDNWLEDAVSQRASSAREKIKWGAIKTLIKQTVYAVKIDNSHDQSAFGLVRELTLSRTRMMPHLRLFLQVLRRVNKTLKDKHF